MAAVVKLLAVSKGRKSTTRRDHSPSKNFGERKSSRAIPEDEHLMLLTG